MIAALDARGQTHSVMLLRHGQVIAEQWWHPHTPEQRHAQFSVSKTFVSMAVGLAIDEGRLRVDDRVIDLLPDDAPADPGENLQAMRVRDLLTMTAGHATDPSWGLAPDVTEWARAFLAAPVEHRPGTTFVYNDAASYLLSAIVHRLTGQRLLDYLTPRLFAPLGITGATWAQCPRGIDYGGWGLAITTEDMAAFGQLLLQRGRWGEDQLLPAAWIDEAMTVHADSSGQGGEGDYGYQMWRYTNGAWRAAGAFGQLIAVWPEHDVVIATTSESRPPVDIHETLFPALDGAFDPAQLAPADGDDPSAADRRFQVPVPRGEAWTPVGDRVEGCTFVVGKGEADDEAPDVFAELALPETFTVRRDSELLTFDAGMLRGTAALGAWHVSTEPVAGLRGEELHLAATYAWTGERTLEVRVAAVGTAYVWTVVVSFAADGQTADLSLDQNVAFTSTTLLRATARRLIG